MLDNLRHHNFCLLCDKQKISRCGRRTPLFNLLNSDTAKHVTSQNKAIFTHPNLSLDSRNSITVVENYRGKNNICNIFRIMAKFAL